MSTKMELECFRIFDEPLTKIKMEIEVEQEAKQKVQIKKEKRRGA